MTPLVVMPGQKYCSLHVYACNYYKESYELITNNVSIYILHTLMTSQPLSSATIVGRLNGKFKIIPFSVPIHKEFCAATTQDTGTGMAFDNFSEPNTRKFKILFKIF